jgi:F-type H+-transporting ATPase subunit a
MEEHKFVIVKVLNDFLVWILSNLGIEVEKGKEIIPSHIVMALLVTLVIILFFKLTVKNLSMFPNKMQNFLEILYKAFLSLIDDVIGTEGRKFLPALATLGIFIASANLIGLLPELGSPTANLNVTVGCALFIFIYYHYQGVRKHGFLGYLKTFAGPAWWLAWLFFPIEIISHFSRPLSLSMRLFGNIFGEDLVIIIIASLIPFIAPLPMMAFAIFTSLLQAFIFVILSAIYLSGAMASEH